MSIYAAVSPRAGSATPPLKQRLQDQGKKDIADQLGRYSGRFRVALKSLAERTPNHADLLFTAPAVAIAMSTCRGQQSARDQAHWLIDAGAGLNTIEHSLGVPRWMRRLPPETFKHRLHEELAGFRVEHEFGRRVLNTMPQSERMKSIWLQWILEANEACDDDFALWVASAFTYRRRMPSIKHIAPLAAFAWYSRHSDNWAGQLLQQQWTPKMGFRRAISETYCWLLRVMLDNCIDHKARLGIWSKIRRIHGIDFVPLLTTDALIQEADAMQNCIAQYAREVLRGGCCLYSLRRNDAYLANIEVRFSRDAPHHGQIVQILGIKNKRPSIDAMRVAENWLKAMNGSQSSGRTATSRIAINEAAWAAMWEPYWQAKGPRGILTPKPTDRSVLELMRALRPLK